MLAQINLALSAKINGTQRRTQVSINCTCCGMLKDISQAGATFNSEKIRPIALVVVKLCLSEGGRQAGGRAGGRAGRQLVENSA